VTLRVAVLGAGGFIGSRVVEMFHLGEMAEPRPVVRTVSALARSSRFTLDGRVADAFDRAALRRAFEGCDAVLHAVAGDRRTILGTLASTYAAAQAAGVRRLVYLSSASVHGQAPPPGTDEDAPVHTRHSVPYNNAKVRAERKLRQLRERGDVELVVLRPGIVYGPRSYWTGGLADELLARQAYLVDGGLGFCNCVYVDNLVTAIFRALTAPGVDRQAFLIVDPETVTWAEFFQPVVDALGMSLSDVAIRPFRARRRDWRDQAARVASSPALRAAAARLPNPIRRRLRAVAAAWGVGEPLAGSPWRRLPAARMSVTEEKALLHRCAWKLPSKRAASGLGYEPLVSFGEACRRSIMWLAFAGYPVRGPRS
jgi:2-alkyl-3-oxoalkanoate reductase